jgi:hypothetical protein
MKRNGVMSDDTPRSFNPLHYVWEAGEWNNEAMPPATVWAFAATAGKIDPRRYYLEWESDGEWDWGAAPKPYSVLPFHPDWLRTPVQDRPADKSADNPCPSCGKPRVPARPGHRHTGQLCFWCGHDEAASDAAWPD